MNFEILNQISQLANIFIVVFIILALANLNLIREYIRKNQTEGLGALFWHFIKEPAWQFFVQFAAVTANGTYIYSYNDHKKLHRKIRRYLGTTLGFALVKVVIAILVTFIFGNYYYFS